MCAALGAAEESKRAGIPARILLIERNKHLGIKILISGGGKCNITHLGSVDAVLKEGFPEVAEQRFLKPSFYRYFNTDILSMLERHGVAWHARENNRVFPDSGRAEQVLNAFEDELKDQSIAIKLNERVQAIVTDGSGWQIKTEESTYNTKVIILATGGVTYKKVGTTGDGIEFSEMLGHTIIPLRSALAPIYLSPSPARELQGVAIRNAELIISQGGREVYSYPEDVLITHRGLSGPATLGISRYAALALERGPVEILCNLLGETEDTLRQQLQQVQQERSTQQVKTWLEEKLPNRLAPFILNAAAIPQDRKWNALTKQERQQLLKALFRYPFGLIAEIPIDRGEVSAGGVSLKEVDPKTMMSRKVPGLFFAGEILDIAGEVGGFNLQAAYSTGWVAGEEAVKYLKR